MDFLHFPLAVVAFITAACVSFCACSPVICTARALGAMDIPRDGRRMHDSPTPRAGGLAIFFGFFAAVLFYARAELSDVVGALLSGMAIMTALGLCDDVCTLPPRVKLAGQACVAIIPLAFGVYAKRASLFGLTVTPPPALSVLLSFLWILVVTNALNLIDGLNGLASGVVMIAAATLALRYALIERNAELSVVCAALSGGAAGFIPYNVRKAKSFMGDCGSLSLGYALAVLTLAGGDTPTEKGLSLSAIFLILAYPLSDISLAVLRRAKSRQGIFTADKKHIHHRLCARGYTKSEAALLLVFATALGCILSLFIK